MTDGISITGLTIGGAALTAIGGMVGSWIRAKYGMTRIHPQPLDVRNAPLLPIPKDHCDERHHAIANETSNLFSRMSSAEQRIAAAEAALRTLDDRLKSMDTKLDTIIGRLL
jgi:hypothetical protein